MGRSKTQRKRRTARTASAQINDPKTATANVARFDGRKRPDAPTANPPDLADPQARVIKTRG